MKGRVNKLSEWPIRGQLCMTTLKWVENHIMYQNVIDWRPTVVIDSMLSVLWTLAGGVGSVCWEVASFWVKVKLLHWPLAESTL